MLRRPRCFVTTTVLCLTEQFKKKIIIKKKRNTSSIVAMTMSRVLERFSVWSSIFDFSDPEKTKMLCHDRCSASH